MGTLLNSMILINPSLLIHVCVGASIGHFVELIHPSKKFEQTPP